MFIDDDDGCRFERESDEDDRCRFERVSDEDDRCRFERESDNDRCRVERESCDDDRRRHERESFDEDRRRHERESANNDWRQENMSDVNCKPNNQMPLTHTHEVLGSVEIAERVEDPHNHRWATISGQAIPCGVNDHFHEVRTRTDFYEDHFHEICVKTGGMIWVGDRHVHFLMGTTTVAENHQHDFRGATMIDDQIGS